MSPVVQGLNLLIHKNDWSLIFIGFLVIWGQVMRPGSKCPTRRIMLTISSVWGRALFIGISTEVYFEEEMYDLEAAQKQYKWLQEVLIEANKPENRARHPWIIVYGHRPLYCTSIGECMEGMTMALKVR